MSDPFTFDHLDDLFHLLLEQMRVPKEYLEPSKSSVPLLSLHPQRVAYNQSRMKDVGARLWNYVESRLPGPRYLMFSYMGNLYLWRCWRMMYMPLPEKPPNWLQRLLGIQDSSTLS